jgi:hypothetical protein
MGNPQLKLTKKEFEKLQECNYTDIARDLTTLDGMISRCWKVDCYEEIEGEFLGDCTIVAIDKEFLSEFDSGHLAVIVIAKK